MRADSPCSLSQKAAVFLDDVRFNYEGPSSFELSIDRLTVETGERLAIQGASGSGKSTLLRLIAGLLSPQNGRLDVFGSDLAGATDTERRQFRLHTIGFVFQDYPLVESLSALENVLLPLRLVPKVTMTGEDVDRARSLLRRLDLPDSYEVKPAALSQGERQRVAIARALVHEAPLLLADEPTTGLDPQRTEELLDLLFALQKERGLTILAASHDPVLAERFGKAVSIESLSTGARC
ncbi:MAG: ABC transporter ATP-binding protein [Acidobacteriota bacterium]